MEKFYLSLFNQYRNTSLVVLLLIISFFAYSAKDFQLDASSDTLILEQDEDLKKYRLVIDDYGSNDFLIVTFTDEKRILTKDNLNQINLYQMLYHLHLQDQDIQLLLLIHLFH